MNQAGARSPMEEGTQPSLLTIPPEMFCKIVEYLKEDPRDILNLSMTCTQLRDLLEEEDDLAACCLEESIPMVLKWLEKGDILNCRGICKRVRKSVNKVLDNLQLIRPRNAPLFPRLVPAHKNPREYERRHFAIKKFRDGDRLIDSVEEIEELRRMIEGKEVSTVVTKKLSFQFTWDEDNPPSLTPPDFLDRMLDLLNTDMLRDQLLHLCLFGEEDVFSVEDRNWTYEIIRRCIAALPNLRRLSCMDLPGAEEGYAASSLWRYIDKGHPLPAAPLQSLTIDRVLFGRALPVSLFQEVARRYCGTLTELSFYLDDNDILKFNSKTDYQFPALVKLELHSVSWYLRPVLARMHAPQLEELSWEIYRPVNPFLVARLFGTLLQKFPLLSELTLNISSSGVVENLGAREEFPDQRHENVKHLELEGHWYSIPLRVFAGFFPNLESISLHSQHLDEQRNNSDPDVVLCRQIQMERSGLWNQLPKLSSFWCGVHLRTRADAEAFQHQPA